VSPSGSADTQPRNEGEVERVDVELDIAIGSRGDEASDRLGTHLSKAFHCDDVVAVGHGVLPHLSRVAEATDADLDETLDVAHVRDVSKRVLVRHGGAVDERHVVEVRVEVNDVESRSKARTTGKEIAWSPPSTIGTATFFQHASGEGR